ncbi:hypothetical protein SFRURICE_007005, partial [Spodoptera frugiperda]
MSLSVEVEGKTDLKSMSSHRTCSRVERIECNIEIKINAHWMQKTDLSVAEHVCSGVFMFVSTVDPGLQELQRYGRLWRTCPIKKKNRINEDDVYSV